MYKKPFKKWIEIVFQGFRANRLEGAEEPDLSIDALAQLTNEVYGYDKPREAFTPTTYEVFEDWFLRELTPQTLRGCLSRASMAEVCSPVQGKVRKKVPSGEMTLKRAVIEVGEFLGLLDSHDLVQFSLHKYDYHHVHSPVDGVVKDISSLEQGELFPDSDSMAIITISTDFGDVKVLCLGEWTVQTFITQVEIGQPLRKLDKLGHFYFGSQVILALPRGLTLLIDRTKTPRVFVGDPLVL